MSYVKALGSTMDVSTLPWRVAKGFPVATRTALCAGKTMVQGARKNAKGEYLVECRTQLSADELWLASLTKKQITARLPDGTLGTATVYWYTTKDGNSLWLRDPLGYRKSESAGFSSTHSYPPGTLGHKQLLCRSQATGPAEHGHTHTALSTRDQIGCVEWLKAAKDQSEKGQEYAAHYYATVIVPRNKSGDVKRPDGGSARQEHRPQACETAGLPPELVPLCKQALANGMTLEKFMNELEKLSPEQINDLLKGQRESAPSKALIYGGLAVGIGAIALIALRKKKRK